MQSVPRAITDAFILPTLIYPSRLNEETICSYIRLLREEGYPVYLDYQGKNLTKQFKKADRIAAAFTLILAEDEIQRSSVSVKNMATQEQVKIPLKDLNAWLKENY